MEILGRTISEKTAGLISDIEQKLSRPVVYDFTDPATREYGYCDYTQPETYCVYSAEALFNAAKKNQINIPFETNLLHELSHLCQIEEGFPYTCTKVTPETAHNSVYYDGLGSTILSTIMDLDVDCRLKRFGFDSRYFYGQRVIQFQKQLRQKIIYEKLGETEFARYAMMVTGLRVAFEDPKMNQVLSLLNTDNLTLLNCTNELTYCIKQIGYDSAEGAFRCLVFAFSAFNLFSTHLIVYRGKEYPDLASVREDFSDIRILK